MAAKAIMRFTFSFNFGFKERAAKQLAVPCENPIYEIVGNSV
jgi:hypothetical protein